MKPNIQTESPKDHQGRKIAIGIARSQRISLPIKIAFSTQGIPQNPSCFRESRRHHAICPKPLSVFSTLWGSRNYLYGIP